MDHAQECRTRVKPVVLFGFVLSVLMLFVSLAFGQGTQAVKEVMHLPEGIIPPPDESHASHEIGLCGDQHYEPRMEFCDTRDNTVYRYVTIGAQTWMAENLNYGEMIPGSEGQSEPGRKYCLHDKGSNCAALYQWAQVVGLDPGYNAKIADLEKPVQGICPVGWHVPSSAEWDTLIDFVSEEQGAENQAETLMYQSHDPDFRWKTNTNPDDMLPRDKYGFEVISTGQRVLQGTCPVGDPNDSWFCNAHDCAMFWTSDDGLGNTDPQTAVNITFTEDIPEIANAAKRISQMNRDASKLTDTEKEEMRAMEEMKKRRAAEQSELQRSYKESQKYQGMAVRCIKN